MKPFVDNLGHPIGFLDQEFDGTVRIFDAQMSYLGFSKPGQGTFDALNRRISPDYVPHLLFH